MFAHVVNATRLFTSNAPKRCQTGRNRRLSKRLTVPAVDRLVVKRTGLKVLPHTVQPPDTGTHRARRTGKGGGVQGRGWLGQRPTQSRPYDCSRLPISARDPPGRLLLLPLRDRTAQLPLGAGRMFQTSGWYLPRPQKRGKNARGRHTNLAER